MTLYAWTFLALLIFAIVWAAIENVLRRRVEKLVIEKLVPKRNLLEGEGSPGDGWRADMLMHVCRDFLALQCTEASGQHIIYYPPSNVVTAMREFAKILGPLAENLKAIGYSDNIDAFINGAMLQKEEPGKFYVKRWGPLGAHTVFVLSEVAVVFQNYPELETMSEEIQRDLENKKI